MHVCTCTYMYTCTLHMCMCNSGTSHQPHTDPDLETWAPGTAVGAGQLPGTAVGAGQLPGNAEGARPGTDTAKKG